MAKTSMVNRDIKRKKLVQKYAGKRADLVITNSNPLDKIENTIDTAYVMVNGRLFDAATMAEIGGKQRPAPEFYFNRQQTGLSVGQEYGPTMEAQGD